MSAATAPATADNDRQKHQHDNDRGNNEKKEIKKKNNTIMKNNNNNINNKENKDDSWINKFLFTPVDISPLVYFRILFGIIMLWEVCRYFGMGSSSSKTKIERYYIIPEFHFKYYGLTWLSFDPLPGMYMYHFFAIMGMLYVFLILGLFYRMTTVLAFAGFVYWCLLEEALFLNHFYLCSILHFLLLFVPANRNCSLDVLINPKLRVSKVPSWTVRLLLIQISIPYLYGGIAKLHPDWLRGEPMGIWMKDDIIASFPPTVRTMIFGEGVENHWWVGYFFSYGGLIYDLFIVPLLMYQPTRKLAVANSVFFHMMNDKMFSIGIFPWLMMLSIPLYFEPELLRPVLKCEHIINLLGPNHGTQAIVTTKKELRHDAPNTRKWIIRLFCVWFTFQGLWPFRQHLSKGDVNWTEESYYFSWQMMIRDKTSSAKYTVKLLKTNTTLIVKNEDYLTSLQSRKHSDIPGMILQFAHFLCDEYEYYDPNDVDNEEDYLTYQGEVEVYVNSRVSYNGRKKQSMVDPKRNLCKCKVDPFTIADWIVPLSTSFYDKKEKKKKNIASD